MLLPDLLLERRRSLDEANYAALSKHKNPGVKSFVSMMVRPRSDAKALAKFWDELVKVPKDRDAARKLAQKFGVDKGMATFHVWKLQPGETYPSGKELLKAVEVEGRPAAEAVPAPHESKDLTASCQMARPPHVVGVCCSPMATSPSSFPLDFPRSFHYNC